MKDLILQGNKTNRKSHRLPRSSSGQRRKLLVLTDSEGPGLNPLEANFRNLIFIPFFLISFLLYFLPVWCIYLVTSCGKLKTKFTGI